MAAIRSFGLYLPSEVLPNSDIAERLGVTSEWIEAVTGIRERRVANPTETVIFMGTAAAKDSLERAGIDRNSIGLVLVSSGSRERRFPGPAASIAHALGLNNVPSFDIPLASAGSLFALALASDLVTRYGPVLIIASERMSEQAFREPVSKEITPLFGDGAGACLVIPGETGLHLTGHVLHSDGAFAEALALPLDGPLTMDGRTVILQASRKIPSAIAELLAQYSVDPQAVRAFLIHQANQNLIDRVAKAVGVPANRFPSNIARYGNTSSASMLIIAAEYFDEHPATPGDRFCFAAFGAGFHWGAMIAIAQ